jgi:MFS family permease
VKQEGKIFYGWWIVAGAFVLLFLCGGIWAYAFPIFYDEIQTNMGWSKTQTALASSIACFLCGALSPIIGYLIPKIGVRWMMTGGCLIAGIALYWLSQISELWQFYFLYGVVFTLGISLAYTIPNYTAISNWFAQRRALP